MRVSKKDCIFKRYLGGHTIKKKISKQVFGIQQISHFFGNFVQNSLCLPVSTLTF